MLYVVDSVTRQWVDQARKAGQPIANTAGDGTYAAGVNRVTELLPVMMADLIQQAPEDQKVRGYQSSGRAFVTRLVLLFGLTFHVVIQIAFIPGCRKSPICNYCMGSVQKLTTETYNVLV